MIVTNVIFSINLFNVMVYSLAHVLCIRETPGSNLGLQTDYTDQALRGFSHFLQPNVGKIS